MPFQVSTGSDNGTSGNGFGSKPTITHAYPLRLPLSCSYRDNATKCIAKHELAFLESGETANKMDQLIRYQVRSLSLLNYHLATARSPKYDSSFSSVPISNDWNFGGVAVEDIGFIGASHQVPDTVALHVVGDCMTKDIWLATGKVANQGDTLWLAFVKARIANNKELFDQATTYKCSDTGDFYTGGGKRKHQSSDDDDNGDDADCKENDDAKERQVWQCVPLIGSLDTDQRPPVAAYSNYAHKGHLIKVGTVNRRYDNDVPPMKHCVNARRAIFTMGDDNDHRLLLERLPFLSVTLALVK